MSVGLNSGGKTPEYQTVMSSRRNTQPIKDQSKDAEQQEKDATPDK